MSVLTETPARELHLDPSAQSVVDWSRRLAGYYGGDRVRLNHLFLAFLEQRRALEDCVNEILQSLLRALGTRSEWIDALPPLSLIFENHAPLPQSPEDAESPDLPFSEDFRELLQRATTLASRLGDAQIAPKHLLIGLFSDELRRFREKFVSGGSGASAMEEARTAAKNIVEAARVDATRIVQGARREAERILEKAETDALRTEVLVRTKEEIVRLVQQRPEGWTLSDLSERLGVSWQSLIWPCRQLLQEGRLKKRGKVYLPAEIG